MEILNLLIIIAALTTAGVLFAGVIGFSHGGSFNRKHGNKLMRARVACQAVALLLLLIAFLINGA